MSLIRKDWSTLDFVVKEQNTTALMAFLHVLYASIHKLTTDCGRFMSTFQRMKFKMKLGYSCMRSKSDLRDHVIQTIQKTIEEKVQLAKKDLTDSISMVNYDEGYEQKLVKFVRDLHSQELNKNQNVHMESLKK